MLDQVAGDLAELRGELAVKKENMHDLLHTRAGQIRIRALAAALRHQFMDGRVLHHRVLPGTLQAPGQDNWHAFTGRGDSPSAANQVRRR